jgi:Holliday junction resolvase RusA-like endonuclease
VSGISFRVIGIPAKKGSWRIRRGRGKAWLAPMDEKEAQWAALVSWAAKEAMRGAAPAASGVRVSLVFELPKPAKPKRPFPVGDVDKLARSTLDALTGIAIVDDVLVVELKAIKRYAAKEPGAVITIEELA